MAEQAVAAVLDPAHDDASRPRWSTRRRSPDGAARAHRRLRRRLGQSVRGRPAPARRRSTRTTSRPSPTASDATPARRARPLELAARRPRPRRPRPRPTRHRGADRRRRPPSPAPRGLRGAATTSGTGTTSYGYLGSRTRACKPDHRPRRGDPQMPSRSGPDAQDEDAALASAPRRAAQSVGPALGPRARGLELRGQCEQRRPRRPAGRRPGRRAAARRRAGSRRQRDRRLAGDVEQRRERRELRRARGTRPSGRSSSRSISRASPARSASAGVEQHVVLRR